jgi:predicted MPP superfamily phosphohydrolase
MFFEISYILYLSGNAYLLWRAWKALAGTGLFRILVFILYLPFSYTFFLWHRLERGEPSVFKETICALGAFYPGVLLYLVLFTVLVDVLRLVNHFFPFFPKWIRENRRKAGRTAFFAVVAVTSAVVFAGLFYARHVRINSMEITIDKKAAGMDSLNLVALSDIHLGPYMRIPRLEKIVRMIKSLDPDVVLILGDIVNEEALTSEKEQLPNSLGKIRARFGVYACMGNHEHFAGIKNSLELLRRSGITGLQNKAELVAGSFYLVGRSNRSYIAHNERRMPLKEILKDVNMNLPVILMDHQPVHLEEAAEAGVDLQLSGHTHGGAVFPITLVNDRLFEIARGYGRKMNT